MKYLLDTNAVSALMKGDENVIRRLRQVPRASVFLPQPVLAEISYGIERLGRSRRRSLLQERFDLICSEIQRAEWTDEVSRRFGTLKALLERNGRRIEDFDAAIAAHAAAPDMVLVSANVEHMTRVPGVEVEDWSRSPAR